MLTHAIIAIIFAATLFLAFIEDYMKEMQKMTILAAYAVIFIVMATTKSVEHTVDAADYESRFLDNDDFVTELTTEPTFIYLSRLVLMLGGTISTMFFIYAMIYVPTKLTVLYKLTPHIFTALLIYIPVYFELHDMIQIRASAAAAFLLASLLPLSKKRYAIAALLMFCAILFHYSAVVFLPFLLLGNRKLSNKWRIFIACLLPACFAMYFLKRDLFSLIPSSLTEGKLDLYRETSENGEWEELAVPYKNLYFMTKCVVLYLCLYYYDYITEQNHFAPMLINLFTASLCILLSMATIPVIGGRISDLYGIVDCVVFTFCLNIVKPQYVAKIAIALVGAYMLVYNMLFTDYFTR